MKPSSFFAGIAMGAAAALLITKKVKSLCADEDDDIEDETVKNAESAVETLRNSVDSLRNELNTRIESEQTYAAQCDDLKDQVAKKEAEIASLKNVCETQGAEIRKLEAGK